MNKTLRNKIVVVVTTILVAIGLVWGTSTSKEVRQVSISTAPDYMMISRADLMALPTSGSAWNTIKSKADASVSPDLCNQDNKADVNALAAGIVYARTGDTAYRTKVISLLTKAMASQRNGCGNAVLALGRQLGGYVLAADFADYRDASFLTWVETITNKEIGGHSRWHVLRFTAYDSSNNWGTFALTSVTIADIYLNNSADIDKDWTVFSAYGVPHGWPFMRPSAYQEAWSCVATDKAWAFLPISINTPCFKSGINLDGAPVADASRSIFPSYESGYIQEANQGFVVMAQVFTRAGRNGWTVNDSQICRAARFADQSGRLQTTGVAYYIPWMANHFCGMNIQTKTPTSGGRLFGFTDWLFSGASVPVTPSTPVPPTSTRTPTGSPTPTKTSIPPSFTSTPSQTPTQTSTTTPTMTASVTPSASVTPTPSLTPTVTASPTVTPSSTPTGQCFTLEPSGSVCVYP